MIEIEKLQVDKSSTLLASIKKIEKNTLGVIFVIDEKGVLLGVLTDGDIRRYLLKGGSLQERVTMSMNPDFVSAKTDDPREYVLKKLDHRVKVLPIVNQQGVLKAAASRASFSYRVNSNHYAQAIAPVRISFGGGGSDVTNYFDEGNQGAVLNAAISLFSHASLKKRVDGRVIIKSLDLKLVESFETVDDFINNSKIGLIRSVVKLIAPDFGFELNVRSDFPLKSGLGGSSAVCAAVLGCFNEFRQNKWNNYELSELAFQSERLMLEIAGGWQDQYATVFGGFNFIEFSNSGNLVYPLNLSDTTILELQESLILVRVPGEHDSDLIHVDQKQQLKELATENLVKDNVALCYQMRNDLLKSRLHELGLKLGVGWEIKKKFSSKISSGLIDEIYQSAINAGALGGKLLGAGGGGFMMIFVPYEKNYEVLSCLRNSGLDAMPFKFEPDGMRSWISQDKCKDTFTGDNYK